MEWNLDFISKQDYERHVREYFNSIYSLTQAANVEEFNKNIIDPIKLTFSYFVTGEDTNHLIESEMNRQVDKSINNQIGYFHQNVFNYIEGWYVPESGFDVVNDAETVFVELKNKHNTMNSSSSQKTYINMQDKLIESLEQDTQVTCMLVEVIAKKSQDIEWKIRLDGKATSHKSIRRVSIDKFYEYATGDKHAFQKLVAWLPVTLKNIIVEEDSEVKETVIIEELTRERSFFKSLYNLAFNSYQGFEHFDFNGKEFLGENFK